MNPRADGGRGRLTIFLGYAAGVGKTFKMLDEAQQQKRLGRDVVVGYFEPHGRQDTIARIAGLETVPRRRVDYRGHAFEEMDAEAILARRPQVCAVDEFPHTNVPGSLRAKRWQDVVALLEAGIDVLTTMNIQHLESLNDRIQEISGVRVRETIPDWIVREADEIVTIDLPPSALLNRLTRGVVYPQEKVQRALESFFKEPTLAALREMALRQAAHEVDARQAETGEARERVLIHVMDSPAMTALIRRGRRVADYLRGECFAVAVVPPSTGEPAPTPAVAEHLAFARGLHIETRVLAARDAASALVAFARETRVTQIFLAKPSRRRLSWLQRRPVALRVLELARDMQVTIVAERRR